MVHLALVSLFAISVPAAMPNWDIEHNEKPCRLWSAFETDTGDRVDLRLDASTRRPISISVFVAGKAQVIPAGLLNDLTAASVAYIDWKSAADPDTKELVIYSNRECGQSEYLKWQYEDRWTKATFTFVHGRLTQRALQRPAIDGEPEIVVTKVAPN
jgi:hypothetical protein